MNIVVRTIDGACNIAKGMLTVAKHAFREPITLEYPEKKRTPGPRTKGRLALLVDAEGKDLCTGCKVCAKVCPCGDLIYIETEKNENNKNYAKKYTIDIGRCIFCGNCVEACAFNALKMTGEYELTEFSREALVYDKKMLTLSVEESEKVRTALKGDIQ